MYVVLNVRPLLHCYHHYHYNPHHSSVVTIIITTWSSAVPGGQNQTGTWADWDRGGSDGRFWEPNNPPRALISLSALRSINVARFHQFLKLLLVSTRVHILTCSLWHVEMQLKVICWMFRWWTVKQESPDWRLQLDLTNGSTNKKTLVLPRTGQKRSLMQQSTCNGFDQWSLTMAHYQHQFYSFAAIR